MKRCIKGGFLVLGGVVGVVGMIIAAMQNPSVEWVTPPGRMIISILENGLLIPTVLFLVLIICGLYILLTESKINGSINFGVGGNQRLFFLSIKKRDIGKNFRYNKVTTQYRKEISLCPLLILSYLFSI